MLEAQILVIGDVHGCFHTFREIVSEYWRPREEHLVQLGDLIDRGNYSPHCVALARNLQERYSDRTHFVKGNHEFEAQMYVETRIDAGWLEKGGANTMEQYKQSERVFSEDVQWMKSLPLSLETTTVLVTHAGVTETPDPWREANPRGVLWNRSALKHMKKLQVIGHTPCTSPEFREAENVWNIDTGAYKGNCLSAIRIGVAGNVIEILSVPTHRVDYIA